MRSDILLFFFFQAEDGIRDGTVTGVQTCALPISFTDSSRAIVVALWLLVGRRVDVEIAIGPVRKHPLTRLKMELGAIELYRDDVRLERHQVGNATDPGIGFTIRPRRQTCVTGVVVAAHSFVWAEGLVFHSGQRGLIDVSACNIPTRREAGLVQD